MSWQIISAIALIILAIVAIIKKVETRMTLLLAGFAMCVLAGHPMAAFQSFIKGMVNINLVPPICAAMGFAAAVTFSKCDEHLVVLLASPLKKIGGWLILIATVVTFLINIAIMSAAGTAATVGATLIPLMIRAGIKPAGRRRRHDDGTLSQSRMCPRHLYRQARQLSDHGLRKLCRPVYFRSLPSFRCSLFSDYVLLLQRPEA